MGCGIRRTCVRLCGHYHSSPICSLDEAEYVLIIEIDPTIREVQITIGGHIRNPQVVSTTAPRVTKQNIKTFVCFCTNLDLHRIRDGVQRLLVNWHGYERLHVRPRPGDPRTLLRQAGDISSVPSRRCKFFVSKLIPSSDQPFPCRNCIIIVIIIAMALGKWRDGDPRPLCDKTPAINLRDARFHAVDVWEERKLHKLANIHTAAVKIRRRTIN